MSKYYIHDGQKEKGPFDLEQLKTEKITKDTPVWYEGLEKWISAGEVEELKVLFVLKVTPPPIVTDTTYATTLNTVLDTPKKTSIIPYIASGIIVVSGIIGWLIYQNKTQADNLNKVQQQVTQQQQEQQQKEQQEILQQKQELAEKDRVNQELTKKYMGYRNNWKNYIITSRNQYTYSEMGGISNLAVIVYNQTDKLIDEVQVRVDYIKANGGLYKSETVSVTNIGPTSSKSVFVPNSDRGISVKMEIESITAKSFHFCYPYGMDGNQNFDPYFCK